jgi:hypothetical protein
VGRREGRQSSTVRASRCVGLPAAIANVDFRREGRAPPLFIGFGEDHLMPPIVVGHNAAATARGQS